MKKDKHGNFIGVGETTAIEILRDIYKTAKILPQYPFVSLINDDYKDSLGDNYLYMVSGESLGGTSSSP